jgi:hypothetical protein
MRANSTPALALGLTLVMTSAVGAQEFHGYPCTQDCSGHEAGYEWAERNGIDDEGNCGGNSNSFIEGCQAYVEENEPTQQENGEARDDRHDGNSNDE